MKAPSQLEDFLRSRASLGKLESTGTFTMAAKKAVEKLAQFQLPYVGAWAVKVIQAAVASGTKSPIRVDLTGTETRFYFLPNESWSLEQLESAFFDPSGGPDRSVRHLANALWAVALNQKRAFQIALAGQKETLVWDGSELSRLVPDRKYTCCYLAVTHCAPDSRGFAWFKNQARAGRHNAELLEALSRNCFACPVPLTADARRLDSLQMCPSHGWTYQTFPLTMGFSSQGDAPFRLPPLTFERVSRPLARPNSPVSLPSIRSIGAKGLKDIEDPGPVTSAFVLTAHMRWVQGSQNSRWDKGYGPSRCYWIQDGAVVGTDLLADYPSFVSAALFLNADGLALDLTTLQLVQDQARADRLNQGMRCLISWLSDLPELHSEKKSNRDVLAAATVFILSIGASQVFTGNPIAGFVAGGLAASWVAPAGASDLEVVEVNQAVEALAESFRNFIRTEP